MKRLFSAIKTAARWQQLLSIVLIGVFVLSVTVKGTAAWSDMSQHKTNIAQGEGAPKLAEAILQKYERQHDGQETEIPVPGAEFALFRVNADNTAIRMDTYVTGIDGQILATELEPGEYYWQETHPAIGFLPETEDGQPKKYHFLVPAEDGQPVLSIAYNVRSLSSISVVKAVRNSDGSPLTSSQGDVPFEFTITFSDEGGYACSIDGGPSQIVESGGSFYLKSGQTAQFIDVPAGIRYEISETPVPDYTTSSENNAGHVPVEGITAAFINTFGVASDETGNLAVTKAVTGEDADPDQEFTFTLRLGGDVETFTLRHGESAFFDHIPVGTDYTVTEDEQEGYTATRREYAGTITVANRTIILPFVNHREETPNEQAGDLIVSKTVTGGSFDWGREFIFEITFTGEGAPESPQTFTLKDGDSEVFSGIPQGVRYTVTEIDPVDCSPDFVTVSGVIAGEQIIEISYFNRAPASVERQLTVMKHVEGYAPEEDREKLFHFFLTINDVTYELDLKPGEISEPFNVQAGDVYSLEEQDQAGYVQSGVINGSGTVGGADIEIIQVNRYDGPEYIDIAGVKTWNMAGAPEGTALPDSVTILLKNGDTIVRTVTADQENQWAYVFEKLPRYDALGDEIPYIVEEVRIPGWRPVVTDYNIENVYQPPVIDDETPVEKAVTGIAAPVDETFTFVLTPVNGAPMPDSDTVRISGAGRASFGPVTYTMPGTYVYTITEADGGVRSWQYDASVYTMTVTVSEDGDGQLTVGKTIEKNGVSAEEALFTNHYDDSGATIGVRVSKIWKGTDNPQSIQVQLYRNGTPYGNPATLSAANSWTRVWSGLDKYAVWTVDEVNVPSGYTKTITGDAVNGFVITNAKGSSGKEQTSVKVTKVWKGDDKNRPQSVAVQLYKDGRAVGVPITLSGANGWKYTWNDLEKGPKWTVKEVNVPSGYSGAVTGDAANGYVITNTKLPTTVPDNEEVVLTGQKTWNHGDNTEDQRPAALTVLVMANGVITMQRRITADEQWRWSFRLPKYDDGGKEIVYTVDEVSVEGYTKTIDGYHLINTYDPGDSADVPSIPETSDDSGGNPGRSSPKAGDENDMTFWMVLMLISLAGLIVAVIPWRRTWDGTKYIPKHKE